MTIQDILKQADKTAIDQVQGKVVSVAKPRLIQKLSKSVTEMEIVDGGGNRLTLSVWEMPNMEFYMNKEIVISAGPRGGLQTKADSYKKSITLQVSKTASFQVVAGISAPSQPQTDVKGVSTPQSENKYRNGQQVGMAINNATQLLIARTAAGERITELEAYLKGTASIYLRASDWLEAGNLVKEEAEKTGNEPF